MNLADEKVFLMVALAEFGVKGIRTALLLGVMSWLACERQPKRQNVLEDAGKTNLEVEPRLQTDSIAYTLQPEGLGWSTSIGFEYHNTGTDTVYVVNCNGHIVMNLQKIEVDGWKDVWLGETNACLSSPLVVPPGGVIEDRLGIWGADPGTPSVPTFTTANLEGEFRLAWNQPILHYDSDKPDFGVAIPLEDRVSNPFRLTRKTKRR